MALKIFISTSIEQLLSSLTDQLPEDNQSVFVPHRIVTQTNGMDNWLKFRLADKLGIAANIKYLRPTNIVSQLFYLTGGNFGRGSFSGDLSWVLFSLLDEKEFKENFPDIAAYFNSNTTGSLKRMGLAQKVADLFDQYQVYRPDMIREWNTLTLPEAIKAGWQTYLWKRTKQISDDTIHDKTEIADHILQNINKKDFGNKLKGELPVVYFFGISVLSPFHMNLFRRASDIIDFRFFLLLPNLSSILASHGPASLKNDLLKSWAPLICETSSIILNEADQNAIRKLEENADAPESLLQKIQFDICNDKNQKTPINDDNLSDTSLTINSCYTVTREVESLYNYLVKTIETSPSAVSVHDISILVTDVDTYAPYIKAVFDNAPYKIPYSIEGESMESSDGIISSLISVLGISEETFTSENIVRLLDSRYIRRQFGISDVGLIRSTVLEANIRFGIENDRKNDSWLVSWQHGIRKIILGICMAGDDIYSDHDGDILPYDDLEGNNALELVRFLHFVELLIHFVKERQNPRSLSEWADYLEEITHNLIWTPGEEANEAYSAFLQKIKRLNATNQLMTEDISYEVFFAHFSQQFSEEETINDRQRGIVFSSLIAKRSLPAKIIAIMGLNFDQFPRKDRNLSYDLMAANPLPGDRSLKKNDKHLFLETIMATREKLYLSYIGQSSKDNKELPPSSLIDQLIDYIETACDSKEKVRDKLIIRQPLHGFSNKYGKDPYYSYLKDTGARVELIQGNNANKPDFSSIDLNRFIAFFKNPFKAFYKNTAGINYDDSPSEELEENELFELDHLDQWKLKNELLYLTEEEKQDFIRRKVMTGELPLKNMAIAQTEGIEASISPAKEIVSEIISKNTHPESIRIDLSLKSIILTGQIDQVFDNRMVFVCFSKGEFKYYLDATIRYLVARASGHQVQLLYVSNNQKQVFKAQDVDKKEALSILEQLAELFQSGHEKIWPFFTDFYFKYLEVNDWPIEKLHTEINKKFADKYNCPVSEPHIVNASQNGFFNDEEILNAFKSNTGLITGIIQQVFPEANF